MEERRGRNQEEEEGDPQSKVKEEKGETQMKREPVSAWQERCKTMKRGKCRSRNMGK